MLNYMETYRNRDKKLYDNKMDYKGPLGVIIYNSTPYLNKVEKGERIAQIVPKQVIRPTIEVVSEFETNSLRGENGFGSTGTHN